MKIVTANVNGIRAAGRKGFFDGIGKTLPRMHLHQPAAHHPPLHPPLSHPPPTARHPHTHHPHAHHPHTHHPYTHHPHTSPPPRHRAKHWLTVHRIALASITVCAPRLQIHFHFAQDMATRWAAALSTRARRPLHLICFFGRFSRISQLYATPLAPWCVPYSMPHCILIGAWNPMPCPIHVGLQASSTGSRTIPTALGFRASQHRSSHTTASPSPKALVQQLRY